MSEPSHLNRQNECSQSNLPTTTLAEVADATEHGIRRVCKRDSLVVGFLAHTGLTLDP